jgi:uncharacterized protein (DUF58 family)
MKLIRYFSIVISLAIIAQLGQLQILFILNYILIGLIIFGWLWSYFSVRFLEISRTSPQERAQVGETFTENFVLRNKSFLPKLWLEIQDASDLPGHSLKVKSVHSIAPRGTVEWQTQSYCSLRGHFRLGGITITAGDPFGLFHHSREFKSSRYLTVYPATFEINNFEVSAGVLPGGTASNRPAQHITTDIHGLRDYMPGDSLNRIHWTYSARYNKLIAKEFELDPLADVEIFLDMSVKSHWIATRDNKGGISGALPASTNVRSHDSTEEYAVTCAATLARHFLTARRGVGLTTSGQYRMVVSPERGDRQLTKLLENLAIVRAFGRQTFAELINTEMHRLSSRDTLLLVTADMSEEWVALLPILLQRKIKIAVILIEPRTFGGGESSLMVVSHLTAMHIPLFLVKRGDDLSQALDSHLARMNK